MNINAPSVSKLVVISNFFSKALASLKPMTAIAAYNVISKVGKTRNAQTGVFKNFVLIFIQPSTHHCFVSLSFQGFLTSIGIMQVSQMR